MQLLQMEAIWKSFPGVTALKGVDFDLEAGEVHALVGHNGAGKSTLMKVLVGAIPKDRGRTVLLGDEVDIANPRRAQQLGISMIYQERMLCGNLTVAENMFMRNLSQFGRTLVDGRRLNSRCQPYLDMLGCSVAPQAQVQSLSSAEQQLVEIAKALAADSRIIIMDEPTSSLTDVEQKRLFQVIAALKGRGVGIIYITHRLEEVFQVSDRITVLRDGGVVGTVSSGSADSATVIKMMVGRDLKPMDAGTQRARGTPVLEIRSLSTAKVKDIDLVLHAGEVLGLTGLVGSGRTELARALMGLDAWEGGEVLLEGRPFHPRSPQWALRCGVALVPEDRKRLGLVQELSVSANLLMVVLGEVARLGVRRRRRESELARDAIRHFSIITPSQYQLVKFLSGGNQQKVVLAKWLMARPKVILLDEPTQGVDVGARRDLHSLIRARAAEGLAILMICTEAEEVIEVCDRVVVLREGRISAQFERGEFSKERINLAAYSSPYAPSPAAP